jgi:hypothetical protein
VYRGSQMLPKTDRGSQRPLSSWGLPHTFAHKPAF